MLNMMPLSRHTLSLQTGLHRQFILGTVIPPTADKLAKLGAKLQPKWPNYKTQAYITALHKHKMLEAWRYRWSNTLNLPRAWFQPANTIPPTLKPTERFLTTDWKMFSRLIQCQTGHTHTREYYKCFVPTQTIECPCGAAIQTCQHITLECKNCHGMTSPPSFSVSNSI